MNKVFISIIMSLAFVGSLDANGADNAPGQRPDPMLLVRLLSKPMTAESVGELQQLLRRGADPEAQAPVSGDTPLTRLCSFALARFDEHTAKAVELLLEFGARPETPNRNGLTPRSILRRGRMEDTKTWRALDREADVKVERDLVPLI